MTTQLQVHANEIPTFEFVDHGSFQVVRVIVTTTSGDIVNTTVFLPEGTTHGDILKSLADAKIISDEVKEKVAA